MSDKNDTYFLIVYAIGVLLVLGGLILFSLLTGCEVMKGKKSIQSDSTVVAKIDSGSVVKAESESKTDWEWFRQTLQFPRDTNVTITNNYPARPEVVIIEGGKGSNLTTIIQTDSTWKQAFDSLSAKVNTTEKVKEVKPDWKFAFMFWAVVALLGLQALKYLPFKITKV
jgi:hypothetical protein